MQSPSSTPQRKSLLQRVWHGILYTLAAIGAVCLGAFILLYTLFDVRGVYSFSTLQELIEDRTIPRPLVIPAAVPPSASDIKVKTDIYLVPERVQFTLERETMSFFAGSIGVALDAEEDDLITHQTYDEDGNTVRWILHPSSGQVEYTLLP